MKIDAYRSNAKPSYGLVVPAGASLDSFSGDVAKAIQSLAPLVQTKVSVELSQVASGDLFDHLQSQIAQDGAGLMKISVLFTELTGD